MTHGWKHKLSKIPTCNWVEWFQQNWLSVIKQIYEDVVINLELQLSLSVQCLTDHSFTLNRSCGTVYLHTFVILLITPLLLHLPLSLVSLISLLLPFSKKLNLTYFAFPFHLDLYSPGLLMDGYLWHWPCWFVSSHFLFRISSSSRHSLTQSSVCSYYTRV